VNVGSSHERVLRSWLLYSKANESLYCFCCRLFLNENQRKSNLSKNPGFNKFWKLNPKISIHENSPEHIRAFTDWKKLEMALSKGKTLGREIQQQIDTERQTWRNVLIRVLDVVTFLAKPNLSFRDHREDVTSTNRGNFWSLLSSSVSMTLFLENITQTNVLEKMFGGTELEDGVK